MIRPLPLSRASEMASPDRDSVSVVRHCTGYAPSASGRSADAVQELLLTTLQHLGVVYQARQILGARRDLRSEGRYTGDRGSGPRRKRPEPRLGAIFPLTGVAH